jgi:hypothetical protein
MNKKYDQTGTERDESRRLERGEAAKQQRRQEKPRPGQQQATDEPRRQHGGWETEEDGKGSVRGTVRDGDSGERVVDEP